MGIYEEIGAFYERYRGPKQIYGKSLSGRALYALHIGSETGPQAISQYAIHGREWITSLLALYHVRRGTPCGGIWILPLTNPDGAVFSESGERPLWKANARGVDLNVNFDARWGTGASNVFSPAPENYVGSFPFSEPETAALRDLTLAVRPVYTVSWHTKGEEIYWEFHQPVLHRLRDLGLARVLSSATGYPLAKAPSSAGGYKDWCIQSLKIPAFTVEAGGARHAHPLGRDCLGEIVNASVDALAQLSCAALKKSMR